MQENPSSDRRNRKKWRYGRPKFSDRETMSTIRQETTAAPHITRASTGTKGATAENGDNIGKKHHDNIDSAEIQNVTSPTLQKSSINSVSTSQKNEEFISYMNSDFHTNNDMSSFRAQHNLLPSPYNKINNSMNTYSFYEQSRKFYDDKELSDDFAERCADEKLLSTGIKLNMSFLEQFNATHIRNRDQMPFYRDFLDEAELKEKLSQHPRRYVSCVLEMSGSHKAICKSTNTSHKNCVIEIFGRSNIGKAFNNDEVLVEILENKRAHETKLCGRVLGVLNRERYRNVKHPVFICTLDERDNTLARPLCKTIPKIQILHQNITKKKDNLRSWEIEIFHYDERSQILCDPQIIHSNPGDQRTYVFLVAIINWDSCFSNPLGAIIKMIQWESGVSRGSQILDKQHAVPTLYRKNTTDMVESLIRGADNEPNPNDLNGRKDLTEWNTFTIHTNKNLGLESALSVERISDAFKVGVHISDVAAIIKKHTPIDEEAYCRAVTFCSGITNAVHMLPEPLSLIYCSLLKNKKRLTISVIFHLETNGRPKQMEGNNFEIFLSVVRSRENFSYSEVQDIITKKESTDVIEKDIKMLHTLAQKIRQIRLGNSMFAMDMFDNDETEVDNNLTDTHEAHCLVEEFTIMANRKVAQWLHKHYPTCTPVRCQPAPSPDSLNNFLLKNESIINCMMRLQNRRISDSLQKPSFEILENNAKVKNKKIVISKQLWKEIVKESKESEPKHIPKYIWTDDLHPLQHMIYKHWTAIQENAEYRCSTNAAHQKENAHFGLEFDIYTHFTSPIRRYFDMIVQRMVHSGLSREASPYDDGEIEEICKHINKMTKKAKNYEKDCMALQQAIAYSSMPPMLHCFVDRLSDKCITFCSPLLRYLQAANRQLTFNLLDIDIKPTIHVDKATEWNYVLANWRKRVFDFKLASSANETTKTEVAKVASDSDDGNSCQTLNPHKDVVLVTLQDWAKMLKLAVSGKIVELKKTVQRVRVLQGPLGGLDDVTTASSDSQKFESTKHFSMAFTQGQILNIQMAAEPQNGVLVLKPALYNMTNNVNLCLQHTDDPVLYLYSYTAKPTCDKYYNCKHYLQRWLPLILMEAVTGAVKGKDSFCINNVPVTFIENRRGTFLLPLDYCQSNNIEIGPTGMSHDNDDENNVSSYGWLCLKAKVTQQSNSQFTGILASHTTSETVWIGHATLSRIEQKRDDVESKSLLFSFDLHERSAAIPDEFRQTDTKFSTEVLKKSNVERRTEYVLKQLPASKNTLAEKIALNRPIPDLDSKYLDVANSLNESDMSWPETSDKQLPLPASNRRQQEAIIKALTSRFSLIYGPPGTGKTYVGMKLIYLFNKVNEMMSTNGIKRKQVLFCSSSNKSVDRIAKYMLRHMGDFCPNFIRVYERSIEDMDYPLPGGTCCSRRNVKDLQADEELKSVTLHHLIRRAGNRLAEKILEFDNMFKDSEYLRDSSKVQEYINLVKEASIQEIANHDVILCTTVVGYSPNVLKETAVNQVIINEAGMCPEPQCMALILAAKAEQVVLIGDHMQLKPSIKCGHAGDLGLEKSLFERYAWTKSARNVQFTMLEQQYRMNPMICEFPSKQFYGSRLVTMLGPWNNDVMSIWPMNNGDMFPHVFVHVEGSERVVTVPTKDGMEQSRSNHAEIEQVVRVYRYLINEGVDQHSISIISQYSAHCDEIKRVLNEQQLNNQSVNTVVSSQGGEWDYVIFSAVRSLPEYKIEKNPSPGWCKHKLGVITDQSQINVVLTRPRKGLIIIGNRNVLSCDTLWKKLLEYYYQRHCIKTPAEFPPPPRTKQERLADAQKQACKEFDETYLKTEESTSNKSLYDDDRNSQTSEHVRGLSRQKNVLRDQDRQKFIDGRRQDQQTYIGGHSQDRQSFIGDHSQDRQEFAGGHGQDQQTFIGDNSQDRQEFAGGHSQDQQTFIGGHSQHRQTFFGGHSQDRQKFAGGHNQDRQMFVDGHSQYRHEFAGGHSQDRQKFAGGHSQDRQKFAGGHSQDQQRFVTGHNQDRQTFFGGYGRNRRNISRGYGRGRRTFYGGHGRESVDNEMEPNDMSWQRLDAEQW